MKKNVVATFFITFGTHFVLFAQPTITSADFPTVTSHWAGLFDLRSGVHNVTVGGAGLNWDYSTGYFVVSDTSFTSFITPASVPNGWGSNFPTSDLAEYRAASSFVWFYELSSTGLYMDGMFDGASFGAGKMDYNPDFLSIPAPFTYNSSRNYTSRLVVLGNQNGYNLRIIEHEVQSIKGDAYGTIKTPVSTFSNTLRLHTFRYKYDSIYVDSLNNGNYILSSSYGPVDSADNYLWYSIAQKAVVASVYFQGSGSKMFSTFANYFDFNLVPNSVHKMSVSKSVSIYPNPAINQPVNFSLLENLLATNLLVYNSIGQLIRSEKIAGYNHLLLKTDEMDAGTYLYLLTSETGEHIKAGKFIVAK